MADSFIHSRNCNDFVPNLTILGQVVLEKSLTKISIFIILDRGIEKGKNRKNNEKKSKHLCFVFCYKTWLTLFCLQNLKTLAIIDAELI